MASTSCGAGFLQASGRALLVPQVRLLSSCLMVSHCLRCVRGWSLALVVRSSQTTARIREGFVGNLL